MSSTQSLLLALITIAPDLERSLGSDQWPAFRDALLMLAGRFEHEGDSPELERELTDLIARLRRAASSEGRELIGRAFAEAASEALSDALPRGGAGTEGGELLPPPPADRFRTRDTLAGGGGVQKADGDSSPGDGGEFIHAAQELPEEREPLAEGPEALPEPADVLPIGVVEVPIFYGTDRKPSGTGRPDDFYSGKRGDDVSYGIARVTVPTIGRVPGDLTSPSWWKLQFTPDPAKHVILVDVSPLEREAFVEALRAAVASADEHDVLVFIHGYNVSFTDAARRAAQIAVDLKFRGRTLLYSWASAGDPIWYTADEDTIEWSTRRFHSFLKLALEEAAARNVHVIAHSMGNRALIRALEEINRAGLPADSATLCQVIFAAPDISCDTFRDFARAFKRGARRCTLYASKRDMALMASKLFHHYPRAGEAGKSLVVVANVDTIDVTRADTGFLSLGHSYVQDKPSILNDVAEIIIDDREPSRREKMHEKGDPPARHWEYGP